ncbi:hypothetical protein ES705_36076 [subsurface metagenome]
MKTVPNLGRRSVGIIPVPLAAGKSIKSVVVGNKVKKITSATYKKDKYYKRITRAVHELLKDDIFVTPVDLFIKIGVLTKEAYEDWRFGRVSYLERVISCNLSKANRILRILKLHAGDRCLKPSKTVYKKWGKGRKILLRFSKSGNPALEEAYSTHYVAVPNPNSDS